VIIRERERKRRREREQTGLVDVIITERVGGVIEQIHVPANGMAAGGEGRARESQMVWVVKGEGDVNTRLATVCNYTVHDLKE
jgi:hypothetical protein